MSLAVQCLVSVAYFFGLGGRIPRVSGRTALKTRLLLLSAHATQRIPGDSINAMDGAANVHLIHVQTTTVLKSPPSY